MSGRLRFLLTVRLINGTIFGAVIARAAPRDGSACAGYAPEAGRRSGLPVDLVLRVMTAESDRNSQAISPKGAMGCMQIMPKTWAYLADRYGLGDDPFDPRMNMIAGAMYLAELAARYGFPGAYLAYNAGPGRYDHYIAGIASLPAETIAYAAGIAGDESVLSAVAREVRWQESSLFIKPSGANERPERNEEYSIAHPPSSDGLFPIPDRHTTQSLEIRTSVVAAHDARGFW